MKPFGYFVSLFIALFCIRDFAAAPATAPTIARPLRVHVVDADGKPVQGVKVGTGFSNYEMSEGIAGTTFKNSGILTYWGGQWATNRNLPTISDSNGIAMLSIRTEFQPEQQCYALDEAGGRCALAALDASQSDLELKFVPICRVSGKVSSKWLNEHHTPLNDSYVYLHWGKGQSVLDDQSCEDEFEFLVPSGKYALQIRGEGKGLGRPDTGGVQMVEQNLQVEVRPGQRTLDLGTIDIEPTDLGKLIGQPAPEFKNIQFWKNTKIRSLKELRGQIVVLDFWGVGCGSCPQVMSDSMDIQRQFQGRGVTFITVSNYSDSINTQQKLNAFLAKWMADFCDARDMTLPVAVDGPGGPGEKVWVGATSDEYHILGWPTEVLIGRDGKVLHIFTQGGYAYPEVIEAALAQPAP